MARRRTRRPRRANLNTSTFRRWCHEHGVSIAAVSIATGVNYKTLWRIGSPERNAPQLAHSIALIEYSWRFSSEVSKRTGGRVWGLRMRDLLPDACIAANTNTNAA